MFSAEEGFLSGARTPIFKTERFGQHILKNADSPIASLRPTDRVLEVGPGTGNLTVRTLEKAKHVTAVEMDSRMMAELTKRVQAPGKQRKLKIEVGDFVQATLPYFDVCTSNTPYQISSPLVYRLLSHRPLFRVAILMFQREFAARLVAQPGTAFWSRLSANVQLYAKVEFVMNVGKNNFRPPPKVESSVVRLVPRDPPPPVEFSELDGLARIVFNRPNKTVHASFMVKEVMKTIEHNWKTWACFNNAIVEDDVNIKEKVEQVLEESGFSQNRAAKTDINDLLNLLLTHNAGIHFA
ncbi:rRNA adenine dimethylase [Cerioporus squamosus]|nr:rRNA adenine dimethylase [Cerioporus squamosus]